MNSRIKYSTILQLYNIPCPYCSDFKQINVRAIKRIKLIQHFPSMKPFNSYLWKEIIFLERA